MGRVLEPWSNGDRVVVTFDDGYADNLEAARALAAKGLPATFFLLAGRFETGWEAWWDELEGILLSTHDLPETLELEIAGARVSLELRNGEAPTPKIASER